MSFVHWHLLLEKVLVRLPREARHPRKWTVERHQHGNLRHVVLAVSVLHTYKKAQLGWHGKLGRIYNELTHHQLVLILSVHLGGNVQSEIDHEQELQLEAIHLRSWNASHLHRKMLMRTTPFRTWIAFQ